MICFRDRSFCSASVKRCTNASCDRFFGPEQRKEAEAWWAEWSVEDQGAPVAFMDFAKDCPDIIPVREATDET